MGRYYNGDIDGKFMFAVQSSDSGERFGAIEEDSGYINYVIYREDSYKEIVEELKRIEESGSVDRVSKMFKNSNYYSQDTQHKYKVSDHDLSEYADYRMGKQIKDFFDNNQDAEDCRFTAEI